MSSDQKAGALEQEATIRRSQQLHRKPSFSPSETFFLHGLLIDPTHDQACEGTGTPLAGFRDKNNERSDSQKPSDSHDSSSEDRVLNEEVLFSIPPTLTKAVLPSHHTHARRRSILGLWKAHELGIRPRRLVAKAVDGLVAAEPVDCDAPTDEDDDGNENAASDVEVRSETSSWDDNDRPDTYDTWEVGIRHAFPAIDQPRRSSQD
jgi:hypothetical protein